MFFFAIWKAYISTRFKKKNKRNTKLNIDIVTRSTNKASKWVNEQTNERTVERANESNGANDIFYTYILCCALPNSRISISTHRIARNELPTNITIYIIYIQKFKPEKVRTYLKKINLMLNVFAWFFICLTQCKFVWCIFFSLPI